MIAPGSARRKLLEAHGDRMRAQIAELTDCLDCIGCKIAHYKEFEAMEQVGTHEDAVVQTA